MQPSIFGLYINLFICFNAHFCSPIYFIASRLSICSHFVSMSVYNSDFLFVYFSPLNGSLVDLNITTGVAKFRRRKVELTVLYRSISRQPHHALTLPFPLFHSPLHSCHQEPTSVSEYQMTRAQTRGKRIMKN